MINSYFDKLVIKNDGTLRHVKIVKIIQDDVFRDPNRMPSDRINPNPGLIFTYKTLGFKVLIDEPIEKYQAWITQQRTIDIEEKKREEQWKKVVAVAELVSLFVPLLGIGGVTCLLLRSAATASEIVAGLDKLHGLITKPAEVITDGLIDFVLGKAYKKFCFIDTAKLNKTQTAVFDVFESARDKAIEGSGAKAQAGKLIQISTLGYTIDYGKVSKVRSEYDIILASIHAFRYQFDSKYKAEFDLFQNMAKSLSNYNLTKFGNKSANQAGQFYIQGK